jgi:hypothetical protein
MGNREANYSMVKLSVYNNLPAEHGEARGDNLAHQRGSVLPPGPQLVWNEGGAGGEACFGTKWPDR